MFYGKELDYLDEDQLYNLLLSRKDFVVYISALNGYHRPIYDVSPCPGHICGYIHSDRFKNPPMAFICRIDGMSEVWESRDDRNASVEYTLQEIKTDSYGQVGTKRFKNVHPDKVICLFKRMDSGIVEQYIDKKWREEEFDSYTYGGN